MSDFLFKAMGEETKFLILKILAEKRHCACDLNKIIKRTQSNTSMHLSKLLKWKIISNTSVIPEM